MTEQSHLDASTVTDDLETSAENEEAVTEEKTEVIDSENNDESEENEESEPQKSDKDYKQKFNSAMSNIRKLQRENEMLKSNKSGGEKLSDDDLAKLREKYDEEDLDVIQKIIKKEINAHESTKLGQREENIFLKDHPETTDAQLKHLKFMQKEFGYSLKYAYNITFGTKEAKPKPQNHSISGGESGTKAAPKKDDSDETAYKDMKKFYGAS